MYTLDTSFGVVKIRFRHIRDHRDLREIPTGLNLFRVVRAVEAEVEFNGMFRYGQAFCSWMDSFNPDKGRVKALREAFAEVNFTRPERAELWCKFFAARPDREKKKQQGGEIMEILQGGPAYVR